MAVEHLYTYITNDNEAGYLPAFEELLGFQYHFWPGIRSVRSRKQLALLLEYLRSFFIGRIRGRRMLLKDPFAAFSSPWFSQQLNCQVVIMVRHPAAFAGSVKRLGWDFDFRNLLEQPLLMRDHLDDHRADMESMHPDDFVGQGALLWKLVYRFVHSVRGRFPQFQIVRHEDISLEPVAHFRRLYGDLGLDFPERVENVIRDSSSARNPAKLSENDAYAIRLDSRASLDNWKRILTPAEVARVRNLSEGVSDLFYTDQEWKQS